MHTVNADLVRPDHELLVPWQHPVEARPLERGKGVVQHARRARQRRHAVLLPLQKGLEGLQHVGVACALDLGCSSERHGRLAQQALGALLRLVVVVLVHACVWVSCATATAAATGAGAAEGSISR